MAADRDYPSTPMFPGSSHVNPLSTSFSCYFLLNWSSIFPCQSEATYKPFPFICHLYCRQQCLKVDKLDGSNVNACERFAVKMECMSSMSLIPTLSIFTNPTFTVFITAPAALHVTDKRKGLKIHSEYRETSDIVGLEIYGGKYGGGKKRRRESNLNFDSFLIFFLFHGTPFISHLPLDIRTERSIIFPSYVTCRSPWKW